MRFGILGPLEARTGDRELNLGGLTQRRVLATLLLTPNRSVSLARLTEAAWDGDPPTTARRQVQNRVSTLGLLFARAGAAGVISNDGVGYRLRVQPDELDSLVFDRLVAEGRAATQAGDGPGAAATLRRALGLWRGPALAGLGGALLEREAAGLDEKRLAALEDCLDLELAAGHHGQVVAELRPLIGEHPLRERLVGQLMLALYRGGRQAEALAAYHELAGRLADELGVDPGAELRRLYEAVLREDPVLRAPGSVPFPLGPSGVGPAAPAPPPADVPAQLPAEAAGFTGRRLYLDQLDALLVDGRDEPAVVISAVAGAAGVGKTALAVHWAHRVRDRFPDGQLYVNLRGYDPTPSMTSLDALARFLRALGVAAERVPAEVDEAAAMYRSLLADKRVLVLLDNAHGADQVRPLLPGSAGCLVVVTSRDSLAGLVAREGARRLTLDVLTPAEARTLLTRFLGADRVTAEPDAVDELAHLCAYLPLALRIAAANLTVHSGQSIAGYTAALREGNRLAALEVAGDEQAAVRAAFDVSYGSLPAPAQRLFRLLGLVPGPDITPDAAAALAGEAPDEAFRLLRQLAGAHLIDQPEPGRFTFHDLLRLYAAEHATREDGEAALGRLYDHYLRTADAAARLLYPQHLRLPPTVAPLDLFADDTAASAWLDAERANLVATVRHTATFGPRPVAWLLADTLRGYFWLRMHPVDWQTVAYAGLAAAEADREPRAQAAALLSLATLQWRQSRYRRAIEYYTRALDLAREAQWLDGESSALGNLGVVYRLSGRSEQAVTCHVQALDIARRTGRLPGQAMNLANLGLLYWDLGELERAAEHHTEALTIYRKLGSRTSDAKVLSNLGDTYHGLGRLADALDLLTQALALYRDTGDRGAEAETLRCMAAVHLDTGDTAQAIELAEAALKLSRETGYRRDEIYTLVTLGTIQQRLGRYREALANHRRALALARETDSQYPEILALIGIATAARSDSSPAHEALDLARRAGYRMLEGQALTALAGLALRYGDAAEAVRQGERALVVHRETGHRLGEARTLVVLAEADPGNAKAYLEEALAVFTETGATPEADQVRAALA
jgi:DNA-binding SARP family transcriptional activator